MKTLLCTAVCTICLMAAVPANAQDNWRKGLYIKGGAGWNHAEDQDVGGGVDVDLDDGYNLTGAVGYDYGDFRTEMEITWRENSVDGITGAASAGGDLQSTAFMFNGYYDIPTGTAFSPYVGAGIGVARVKADNYTAGGVSVVNEDDSVFAYQAMAGVEYAVAPQVDLYTEYKYFATDDVDFGGGVDADYKNHAITAGVKYSFN